ncbi:MAG: hypothetical protein M0R80_27465 [Proteobacteria bacterium]|jgi:hypothetical protein|nr:hypothetical protein [Pseudomonadota bacterium]
MVSRSLAFLLFALALGCGDKPVAGEGNEDQDTVGGLPLAKDVQLTDIELYQGVRVPIMEGGESAISGDVPIVAGRDTVIRAYVQVEEGFEARTLWLRVELTGAGDARVFAEENEVSASSTAGSIASTLNVTVPGAELEAGQAISVSIHETVEDAPGSGSDDGALWPTDGEQDLGVTEQMAPMKLVLVPVEYNADGSGRLPDTSAAQLELFEDYFYAMYPVSGVEITVDDPMPYGGVVGAYGNGWDNLLNTVTQRRTDNGAGVEEFYYGLVSPEDSFGEYCSGGCVTGMSWQPTAPGSMQVGTGIGFPGDYAANTAVHEVGHSSGLGHAPCGGPSGVDPLFPYGDGGIGVMGYDVTKEYGENPLKDPNTYKDMMTYCDPDWISDYHFGLLFERVDVINQYLNASIAPPPGGDTLWLSVSIGADGSVAPGPTLLSALPFEGEPRNVAVLDGDGAVTGEADGVFVPRADGGGGLVVFRDPGPGISAIRVAGYPAVTLSDSSF